MRVLILGGTTEGRALANALAGDRRFAPVYSLAGRTAEPQRPGVTTRIGGFGGADGLAAWLRADNVEGIVDATHPFAARISANAAFAAKACGRPLLRLQRPPWHPGPEDDWREAGSVGAAALALGEKPTKAFLSIGRNEVAAFRAAPHHRYLVRAVDPPARADLPPHAVVVLQRGPFDLAAELTLMRQHGIEVLVSKNSGGGAAHAKIVAARQLRIPVVMVARPQLPEAEECADVASALRWLESRV